MKNGKLKPELNQQLMEQLQTYFPYESYRNGQQELIRDIAISTFNKEHIIVEAVNGFGKTCSVLTATLPIIKEQNKQILYCCRTHKQMDRVVEELHSINKKVKVSGISIRGRVQMCLNGLVAQHAVTARDAMEICRELKKAHRCSYYENIRQKSSRYYSLMEQIQTRPFSAPELITLGKRYKLCPYEMVKEVLPKMDVAALSYNYLFDPDIRMHYLGIYGKPLNQFVLVMDEAHNLPELATRLAGDRLTSYSINGAVREARRYNLETIGVFAQIFKRAIDELKDTLEEETKIHTTNFIKKVLGRAQITRAIPFFKRLKSTGELIRRKLLKQNKFPRSYIYRLGSFLLNLDRTRDKEDYIHVVTKQESRQGREYLVLEIVSLDPRNTTKEVIQNTHNSISLSGTLSPMNAYIDVIGLPESTSKVQIPSPFKEENISVLVSDGVSTSMRNRNATMYRKLNEKIVESIDSTPGNIGVFTASYKVLQGLVNNGIEGLVSKELFIEKRNATSIENDKLIANFRSHADHDGAVLLGVAGGRNSEGQDFPGNDMNTVIIVGVPYARPTTRVKAQIEYMETHFPNKGWVYGYQLPAMKRAAQAAGRPIRTLQDRGAIVLLDARFATPQIRGKLPNWIKKSIRVLPDKKGVIKQILNQFYNESGKNSN